MKAQLAWEEIDEFLAWVHPNCNSSSPKFDSRQTLTFQIYEALEILVVYHFPFHLLLIFKSL